MARRTAARRSAAALLASALFVAAHASPAPADGEEPNSVEQYMIEVLNRTRAAPDAEAARFRIDLNEGLPSGTLTNEPREPLAVNFELVRAARLHNRDLFAHFSQLPADHRGSDGRDPTQRALDAGASFLSGVAENNSWITQGSTAVNTSSVNRLHALLFKDFTPTFEVEGRGHRKVMLNGSRNEVGVGVAGGIFGGRTAALCTQDFVTSNRRHITGVAYADEVTANAFYTPGEGLWGARVVATRRSDGRVVETSTWRSGGYNLLVEPGTYDVTAEGGGLPERIAVGDVVVADRNVKVDFAATHSVPVPPPPHFELRKGGAKLAPDGGAWTLAVTDAALSIGAFTFEPGAAAQVFVEVDGTAYFLPQDRASAVVVEKLDPATGRVRKLVVKDASGNSFTLDLGKSALKLALKSAPGFDPTDGTVRIDVHAGGRVASVSAGTELVGTNRKMKLLRAAGTVN